MKPKMKVVILIFTLLICNLKGYTQEIKTPDKINEIENSLLDLTGSSDAPVNLIQEMEKYNVPGLGLVVINENKIANEKYYGVTKIGTDQPITKQTLFEAASVTKMITAILVMHYVETGKIKLDQDINIYLKRWKLPTILNTKESPVTIDRILTHTAGFNRPEGGFSFAADTVGNLIDILKGQYPAQNQPLTIDKKPGEWNYSNFGYVFLQFLLEEISGKPFSELAREIVFEPLKMKNSSMGLPLTGAQLSVKAYSHSMDGKYEQHGLQEVAFGHGGLVTTPSDMALLMNELMLSYSGKSTRLLSKEYTHQLISNRLSLDPSVMGGLEVNQGYGLLTRGNTENICFMMAGQNMPGATCAVIGFPGTGQGAVVMTNGQMGELVQLEIIAGLGKVFNWPSSRLF